MISARFQQFQIDDKGRIWALDTNGELWVKSGMTTNEWEKHPMPEREAKVEKSRFEQLLELQERIREASRALDAAMESGDGERREKAVQALQELIGGEVTVDA